MIRRLAAPLVAALLLVASLAPASTYDYGTILAILEDGLASYRNEYPEVPETDEDAAAIRAVEKARKIVERAAEHPTPTGFAAAMIKVRRAIQGSPDGGAREFVDEIVGEGSYFAFECEVTATGSALELLAVHADVGTLGTDLEDLLSDYMGFVETFEELEEWVEGQPAYARRLAAIQKAIARLQARVAGRGLRAAVNLPPEGSFEFAAGSVTGEMFVDPETGLPWRVDLVATRRNGDTEETVRLSVRSTGSTPSLGTRIHDEGSLQPGIYYPYAGPGTLYARVVNEETTLSFPPSEGTVQIFSVDGRKGSISGTFSFDAGAVTVPSESSIEGTFAAKRLTIVEESPVIDF
jgi:hypothetical protein